MNRKLLIFVTLFGALVVVVALLLISSVGTTAQTEFGPRPTFVPAGDLTPVPTPPDDRQVAILTLVVSGDGEDLRGIQLERGQIINSYAPNVANRPGEWMVEVTGDGSLSFGIEDPRRQHVYGEREQEEQAHMSEYAGNLAFDLVVPLYDLDRDLQAKEIRIFDAEGNEIFVTEIDREGWTAEQ